MRVEAGTDRVDAHDDLRLALRRRRRVLREVSVLCGAGGGLTVQPPKPAAETSTPAVAQTRRARFGTPHRVSVPVWSATRIRHV